MCDPARDAVVNLAADADTLDEVGVDALSHMASLVKYLDGVIQWVQRGQIRADAE